MGAGVRQRPTYLHGLNGGPENGEKGRRHDLIHGLTQKPRGCLIETQAGGGLQAATGYP